MQNIIISQICFSFYQAKNISSKKKNIFLIFSYIVKYLTDENFFVIFVRSKQIMKNAYVKKVWEEVKAKKTNEPEFLQAVEEVFATLEPIEKLKIKLDI